MNQSNDLKYENLIKVFDNALTDDECKDIFKMFKESGNKYVGQTPTGVHASIKSSTDLLLAGQPEWQVKKKNIKDSVDSCLQKYCFENLATIFAYFPIMKKKKDGSRELIDINTLRDDKDKLLEAVNKIYKSTNPNLQYYKAGTDGYHAWHCEHTPLAPQTLKRVMFWILYLNEEFENGETEFFHQDIKIKPKTGRMLIAPCAFTHAHRGNVSKGGDKLIATGWYELKLEYTDT